MPSYDLLHAQRELDFYTLLRLGPARLVNAYSYDIYNLSAQATAS